MENTRLGDLIDFAIEEEHKASELYAGAAKKAKTREQKTMLEDLALVETGHEKKLAHFKATGIGGFASLEKIVDLRISDFLVDTEIGPESSIQDIFIFAMKSEQKAYELYTFLESIETEPLIKKYFKDIAAEEKKHKLDFETQYEKMMLREV
jgi:rubrerythrin